MSYMRRPKTKQEKVRAVADSGIGIPPRGKRAVANLPDSHDDIMNGSMFDRCWKRFRKTKWRRIVAA